MALIRWQNAYSVGIDSVDAEHRELIDAINALHDAISDRADPDTVLARLKEIHDRMAAHFASEERLMRRSRYRLYEEHKQDHDTLLDEMREIIAGIGEDGEYAERELVVSLDRWFSDHFRDHDAKLHGKTGK